MKFKKFLVLIISIFSLALSGCVGVDNGANINGEALEEIDENVSDSNEQIQDIVTSDVDGFSILINRTRTLNPLLSSDKNLCYTLGLVYQNIVNYTEDDKVSLNLIDSYEFNPENNTYLITIKGGLVWDDGEPITVDDFIYSYNTLKNAPADAYYKSIISDVVSFTKQSNTTFTVKTNNANTGNPYFLAFPLIPEHKKNQEEMYDAVHFNLLVGNGIYKNTSNSVNDEILLEDNPTDNITPPISQITLKPVDENTARYYGFEQDISDSLTSTVSAWSKYHTSKSVNINSYNNMEMTVLGFNFNKELMSDINFRECVYNAIPFEQIKNSIYLGYCGESNTLYPQNHFAHNDNIVPTDFDAFKAEEYLKKTSYGGQELKLITIGDNKELTKTADIIKSNLDIINVNVAVYPLSYEEYMTALDSGDYDMYLGRYKMSILPDFSKLVGEDNYSNYKNDNLVTLLNNLDTAKSYDEYKNTANSVQSIVYTEKPVIPIVHNNDAIITSKCYVSVAPESYNNPYQNIDKWSIIAN